MSRGSAKIEAAERLALDAVECQHTEGLAHWVRSANGPRCARNATVPPTHPVRKAVIPAAGLGTRFLPATKAQPKEMLPVVDKPAIQYVVEEAVEAGIDDILIITGRGKRSIEDHFDRNFELEYFLQQKGKHDDFEEVVDIAELADIHYVRQGEPLGLGHAVSVARKHVGDNPFVVMLGDEFMAPGFGPARRDDRHVRASGTRR